VPWQARLVLLASIWGMSFLFIKVCDGSLAPLQVALGRNILGAVILLLILATRREGLPREKRVWLHLSVVALLFNVIPFVLFAYGETRTTSVLAGIWNATTPLFTLPLAVLVIPAFRPSRRQVTGAVIGFLGVLIVLGVWQGFGGSAFIGNLACLGAAACYGLAFPYTRRNLSGRSESTTVLATSQLLCGIVMLAVVTPFVTSAPTSMPLNVIGSLLALGMLGTGIAYILNYSIIRDAGPASASTVTYLVPLVSTAVGVALLGEPLTWYEPVGALVVIAGVAVSQGRLRRFPLPRLAGPRLRVQ
jgi:drug/metabolite transporter (DMT)-like permease